MHWPTKSVFNWSTSDALTASADAKASTTVIQKDLRFIVLSALDGFQKLQQRRFVSAAQRFVLVPRVAGLAAVAFDGFLHRFGAAIVQELLAVAQSHQQFRPELRRVGLFQADIGKLGSHVVK